MLTNVNVTLAGNLVDDVELRFTASGVAVARFRIASTPRYQDKTTGEWQDGESTFLTVQLWRQPAENAADSLRKGDRVLVSGQLQQRSYETKEGEKRTVYELQADEVAASLAYSTAKLAKASRSPRSQEQSNHEADPWSVGTTEPPF